MGHSRLTSLLASSLFATFKARATSITIRLPSLGDPSGGFDAPTEKCPPDRGSSDWVTDSPAPKCSSPLSNFSLSSSVSSFEPEGYSKSLVYPPTPPPENPLFISNPLDFPHVHQQSATVAPKPIKAMSKPEYGIVTPPYTPEDSRGGDGSLAAISARQSSSTRDFLTTLFPRHGLRALPYAEGVSVSSSCVGSEFDGVVLGLPGTTRTLYIDGKDAASINLRESIVALLDLADEQLECNALVIALSKSSPVLGDLLHSLMYVGGTVVTKPPFETDPAYVLVGLEI